MILILLSIFLFTFLDWLLILAGPSINAALPQWWLQAKLLGPAVRDNLPAWYLRWPLRIVGLIPLAGLSYEVIKAAFKCYTHPLLRREVCGGDFEAELSRGTFGMSFGLPFVADRVRLKIQVEAVRQSP